MRRAPALPTLLHERPPGGDVSNEPMSEAPPQLERAYHDALAALGRRALSREELAARLVRRGHAESTAERVLERLSAAGLIDDEMLARDVAASTVARTPAAARLVADRLRRRGIDTECAERVSHEVTDGTPDLQGALRVARAQLRTSRETSGPGVIRRVATALARRGYDEETVEAAMRELGLLDDLDA